MALVVWTLARTTGLSAALYDSARAEFVAKGSLTDPGIVDSGEEANIAWQLRPRFVSSESVNPLQEYRVQDLFHCGLLRWITRTIAMHVWTVAI